MQLRSGILVALCFLLAFTGLAQEKKRLSHDDYAGWNTINRSQLSPAGDWVVYEVNPQEGDGELVIRHIESGRQYLIPRATRASISPGGKYVAFHIKPQQAVERQAKVEKKRRDEMPVDSLGIFVFATANLEKIPALQSFSMPEEASDWMAYIIDQARLETPEEEAVEEEPEDPGQEPETLEEEKKEKPGKVLFVYNPVTGGISEVKNISAFVMSPSGNLVAGLTEKQAKDTLSLWEVVSVETGGLASRTIDSRYGEMKNLAVDRQGDQLVWMFSSDTAKAKAYNLYLYQRRRDRLNEVVSSSTSGMPEGHGPSEHGSPRFSHNGERLFFGTAPLPVEEPEDTLLAEEKYRLDIWHWEDPMLQSQQLVMLNQLRRRNFQAVYHIRQGTMVQLADEDMPAVSLDPEFNAARAMGQATAPYMIERQWTGGNPRDIYAVDLAGGQRRLVATRAEANASISPGGNFIIWYDTGTLSWKVYSMQQEITVDVSAGIPYPVYNEDNDLPMFARPHGLAGWTSGDEAVLIYDRFDVWKVDPRGRRPAENLTGGYGRQSQVRLRIQELDDREHYIRLDGKTMLSAFNEQTKQSGFYLLQGGRLSQLLMGDYLYSQLEKAQDAERFLWRRSTYTEFPDLWTSTMDFSAGQKISKVNPQQEEYYWGSVELVEWKDFDNQTLQGLLYLPEDFDPARKYPMLVYFYERSSQGLFQHFIPSPSRSTINRSYCTSNGYIVFVPDITYKEGFPGESAYNAIVSGTKAMVERYPFIDRENMGLQGQSWGGYQIAYLVTRTNMFRAAMAGAPVSNMVSAYGGIRWQTGLNRQFQYEQTQSRIGGTLWERPVRYIENSPIFFVDKIETPLLMMHNDADGAVPWYQGIEMFVAMRRLGKPVWMLNYNDEAHNLTRWPNRMDLSVRMYQFFDHYLKGEPAPVWLKHGIPATDKGRTHGYELVE
jgi:dipeptidyl aminopeptidase/acylaminoacyl peptidase